MSNYGYDEDITGSREDIPRNRRDNSETRVIEGRKHHVTKDGKGREVNALHVYHTYIRHIDIDVTNMGFKTS